MTGAGGPELAGPWRHRVVAANGIRFHVVVGEHFSPARPLVLLLHGLGQFWWAWRHQVPALDAAGYSVAAMDLRGHGGSDKTPRGYDPHTTAYDVAGVVKSLGFGSGVLVGHDWGGLAGWATLAYAAGPVRAFAAVAAPHPLAFPWRANLGLLALAQLPGPAERRLLAATPAGPFREALRPWPGPQRALAYPRTFVRDRLRPSGWEYRRALRTTVTVPLLSIHGAADRRVPLAAMTAADRWLDAPHTVVDLPGVGHRPHEEAPAAVTAALLDWLPSA